MCYFGLNFDEQYFKRLKSIISILNITNRKEKHGNRENNIKIVDLYSFNRLVVIKKKAQIVYQEDDLPLFVL